MVKPTNNEVAKLLREVAAAYTVSDEKKYRFQILAYQRAADVVEKLSSEVYELWSEGKLEDISGIGSSIASHLNELFATGKVKHFDEIKRKAPPELFPLLAIPKIGPKTAVKLINSLKIKNADQAIDLVEKAGGEGKIAVIPTFGEKSQKEILQAISEFRQGRQKTSRMVLPYAYEIAQKVLTHLKKCPDVQKIEPLGSLRRMVSTTGDIDIAVASDHPQKVIDWFVKYPYAERVIEKGDHTASFLTSGSRQIDLMVQPANAWGSLLQHFTGSKDHNVKLRSRAITFGLSVSDYGIKITDKKKVKKDWLKYYTKNNLNKNLGLYVFDDEKTFYHAQGLKWIEPELREDQGEIESSLADKLPKIIQTSDIKGDLHTHSSFDIEPSHDLGQSEMAEMVKSAQKFNYEYLGFAEHNPSNYNHTPSQVSALIKKRNEKIVQAQKITKNVQILKLLEIDILADGKLAIDDKSFSLLDAGIVSIHSSFSQDKEQMTQRVLKGLSHPRSKILGHPTGRLLGQRSGFELDWEKIWEFCAKNNKALEINAFPTRLDISDTIVRETIKRGVKVVIDTDSHEVSQMKNMKFGVAVARRGWAEKKDVLNTYSFSDLKKWLLS